MESNERHSGVAAGRDSDKNDLHVTQLFTGHSVCPLMPVDSCHFDNPSKHLS